MAVRPSPVLCSGQDWRSVLDFLCSCEFQWEASVHKVSVSKFSFLIVLILKSFLFFLLLWPFIYSLPFLNVMASSIVTPSDFCNGFYHELDGRLLGSYTWLIRSQTSKDAVTVLYLSLCEPLNFTNPDSSTLATTGLTADQLAHNSWLPKCDGAVACSVTHNFAAKSTDVKALVKPDNITDIASYMEIRKKTSTFLFLSGVHCAHPFGNWRIAIGFDCGTHLGSPKVTFGKFCQFMLSWRTSAACGSSHNVAIRSRVRVPCYIVDGVTGGTYDLGHLTRVRGSHKVDAKMDLYINVCQDIADEMIGCSPGTAACLNLQGATWQSVGLIKTSTRVQFVPETGDLIITYNPSKDAKPFQNCPTAPSTVIHFRCPHKRGRGRPPRLLADISCQYVIEWETDHACPVDLVTGDARTCRLKVDRNVVDLARLRNPKVGYHNISGIHLNGTSRVVFLSICGLGIGSGGPCGSMYATQSSNVCFKDLTTGQAFSLGSSSDALLRYTDGRALLVYPDGSVCYFGEDGSHRKWSTIVEFICDPEETFNKPAVADVDEELCILRLEWRTMAACTPEVIMQPEDADYNELLASCTYRTGKLNTRNAATVLVFF